MESVFVGVGGSWGHCSLACLGRQPALVGEVFGHQLPVRVEEHPCARGRTRRENYDEELAHLGRGVAEAGVGERVVPLVIILN